MIPKAIALLGYALTAILVGVIVRATLHERRMQAMYGPDWAWNREEPRW